MNLNKKFITESQDIFDSSTNEDHKIAMQVFEMFLKV